MSVLPTWPAGCHQTGSNSTHQKRNWCVWCSSPGRRQLVLTDSLAIGLNAIKPVVTVKDLGMYLDATMSTRNHISRPICFGVLRQIRCIWRSLSSHTRTMLITCFVFVRLEYCNVTFTGLPRWDLVRLQAVQNAAVRLISGARKFDDLTTLLHKSNCLQVEHHITFKMTVMTYKCVYRDGRLPCWLHPAAAHAAFNLCLRSNTSGRLFVPRSKTAAGTGLLQWLDHACGTVYLPLSHQQVPWPSSKTIKDILVNGCIRLIELCSHVTLFCFVNFFKRLWSDLSPTPLYKWSFTFIHTILWTDSSLIRCHITGIAYDVEYKLILQKKRKWTVSYNNTSACILASFLQVKRALMKSLELHEQFHIVILVLGPKTFSQWWYVET